MVRIEEQNPIVIPFSFPQSSFGHKTSIMHMNIILEHELHLVFQSSGRINLVSSEETTKESIALLDWSRCRCRRLGWSAVCTGTGFRFFVHLMRLLDVSTKLDSLSSQQRSEITVVGKKAYRSFKR